ncbi:MAG TPA: hypothetical protein VM600_07360 [Actinomycetota bacterium]|nr:hypothetical protein [Actinomycetota bacterium]
MTKRFARARLAAVAAALAVTAGLTSACGGGAAAVDVAANQAISVPPVLGGLEVSAEPKATERAKKEAAQDSYAADIQVFSLRKAKELRAVLQVIRLTPDARPEDREFRREVIGKIGGTTRAPEKIAETLVYRAKDNQKVINLWFKGRFMLVLIVREAETVAGVDPGVNSQQVLVEALSLEPQNA